MVRSHGTVTTPRKGRPHDVLGVHGRRYVPGRDAKAGVMTHAFTTGPAFRRHERLLEPQERELTPAPPRALRASHRSAGSCGSDLPHTVGRARRDHGRGAASLQVQRGRIRPPEAYMRASHRRPLMTSTPDSVFRGHLATTWSDRGLSVACPLAQGRLQRDPPMQITGSYGTRQSEDRGERGLDEASSSPTRSRLRGQRPNPW